MEQSIEVALPESATPLSSRSLSPSRTGPQSPRSDQPAEKGTTARLSRPLHHRIVNRDIFRFGPAFRAPDAEKPRSGTALRTECSIGSIRLGACVLNASMIALAENRKMPAFQRNFPDANHFLRVRQIRASRQSVQGSQPAPCQPPDSRKAPDSHNRFPDGFGSMPKVTSLPSLAAASPILTTARKASAFGTTWSEGATSMRASGSFSAR